MSKKHPNMDEIFTSINYHPYLDEHWKHPNLDVDKYIPILEYWKHPNVDVNATFSLYIEKMSKKHPFMNEIVISINYHPYLESEHTSNTHKNNALRNTQPWKTLRKLIGVSVTNANHW